jgi:ectoine hydroxylase
MQPTPLLDPSTVDRPTAAERFFFDNNGYLVLEHFLAPDHVTRLLDAVLRCAARRREAHAAGAPQTGFTHVRGENTRFFYILGDDPLFLELLDWPDLMPYVVSLLSPIPHHHASDAIVEVSGEPRGMGWHIDGHDQGYRGLGWPIPLLQLKVGYFLTDMSEPGQGNLCVVPGSHRARYAPDPSDLKRLELFPGALQVCAPAGSAVLFHNALWHTAGPVTRAGGRRILLYYAYEHPWMVASMEHWSYPPEFYAALEPRHRRFFHGFVFQPPEQRWG